MIKRSQADHVQVILCFRVSVWKYITKTQTPTDLTFYLMTE